ncbi:hypothetical protein E4U35_007516 [Claviceps purpurea]|uniref:Related to blastomyces yeast phase-specific protein 1 n=1 Tax=Claviceps purpurea (strain 20.1) TaxID=1111077 RepID=M1W3N7_CLAP2|nr:hypothetical protein E4U11_008085 [Claviceps purpurea]KAG6197390.1 hypothetical protein E4U35_007516 [Claviceps purpurea]KAG6205267.1 hypothetical protein E4U50_004755 [Claviceps purpurea]KAG6270275.1 hypothetical protein E4U48_003905 [Claviceps purpurea]CCE32901.1 related to blastomyces yeast phase-specific protein 1 [Claviceps purpurea 20.1]
MLGHAKAFLLSLGLTTAVSALGNAVVYNNCNFPVTVWSVGSNVSPGKTLQHGGSYSEVFTRDPKTGGRAIKITRGEFGLFNNEPQTVFAYTLNDQTIWYDLSDVFGDAFKGSKMVVKSVDKACPAIVWPNGLPMGPGVSEVKNCGVGADVKLSLCAN